MSSYLSGILFGALYLVYCEARCVSWIGIRTRWGGCRAAARRFFGARHGHPPSCPHTYPGYILDTTLCKITGDHRKSWIGMRTRWGVLTSNSRRFFGNASQQPPHLVLIPMQDAHRASRSSGYPSGLAYPDFGAPVYILDRYKDKMGGVQDARRKQRRAACRHPPILSLYLSHIFTRRQISSILTARCISWIGIRTRWVSMTRAEKTASRWSHPPHLVLIPMRDISKTSDFIY